MPNLRSCARQIVARLATVSVTDPRLAPSTRAHRWGTSYDRETLRILPKPAFIEPAAPKFPVAIWATTTGSVPSTAAWELLKNTCAPPTLPSSTTWPPWNSAMPANLQRFQEMSALSELSQVGIGLPKYSSGAEAHGTTLPSPRLKSAPPSHMMLVTTPGEVSVALTIRL